MDILSTLDLDNTDQSGLSKMYLLETLISHYHQGDNCFINDQGEMNGDLGFAVSINRPVRRVDIGAVNFGLSVRDDATGTGYMMYSIEPIRQRFGSSLIQVDQADHLLAVRYNVAESRWEWSSRDIFTWVVFTPVIGDHLLATLDFDTTSFELLSNVSGEIQGVPFGFLNSNITMISDIYGGSSNPEDWDVDGAFFEYAI